MTPHATPRSDIFNFQKTSDLVAAQGHAFDAETVCKCGRSWSEQRKAPTICSRLMERLQQLEETDIEVCRAVQVERAAQLKRIGKLNGRIGKLERKIGGIEWGVQEERRRCLALERRAVAVELLADRWVQWAVGW